METIKKTVIFFLIWRFILFAGFFAGLILQPPLINYLGGGYSFFTNPILWSWANFDGVHYLFIAQYGYGQFQQAFFPLYPLLVSLLGRLFQMNYLLAGLFISHLSLFIAIILLYKLVKIDFPEKIADWVVLFLLFFPTSFYFGSIYTESLFLLLMVSTFYAARIRLWWLAGIIGALASLTRVIGVFLFPVILWEYFKSVQPQINASSMTSLLLPFGQNNKRFESKRLFQPNILWLMLIPAGLLLYMFWLNQTHHDPLAFIRVQPAFGAGRSGGGIILLPQVIFRYLKIFVTSSLNYQYFVAVIEFITFFLFLVTSLYGFIKLRLSYALFSFFAIVTPTFTGSLSSIPRYVLILFPCFLVLASIKSSFMKQFMLILFTGLLIVFTALFTRGFWIA